MPKKFWIRSRSLLPQVCVEYLVLCSFHSTSGMISDTSDAGKLLLVAEADKSNFFVSQGTVITIYCVIVTEGSDVCFPEVCQASS